MVTHPIWTANQRTKWVVLAFIIPQNVTGQEPLAGFLTSVDTVELETGLDLFSDLEDGMENRLESESAKGMWR